MYLNRFTQPWLLHNWDLPHAPREMQQPFHALTQSLNAMGPGRSGELMAAMKKSNKKGIKCSRHLVARADVKFSVFQKHRDDLFMPVLNR